VLNALTEFEAHELSEPTCNSVEHTSDFDSPSLEEAIRSPNANCWWEAIFSELSALDQKGVYEDIDRLPPGRKAVKHKWVLKVKRDKDGRIQKYKARLVAKGYSQIPGQDFTFTFAPTARWDSIRIILTLAAINDWDLRHVDIKTAFLNGQLDEEIYMEKPSMLGKGFWRLRKGLYGLKQSGRQWYKCVNQMYQEIGFARCESDWGVYRRFRELPATANHTETPIPSHYPLTTPNHTQFLQTLLTMSVDDMLYTSSTSLEADHVRDQIGSRFEITDMGEAEWILGCRITRWRSRKTLKLDQELYTTSLLRKFGFLNLKPASTPMDPKARLCKEMLPKTAEEKERCENYPYRELVGSLIYLAVCTRADIAYAVRELGRFMSGWGEAHWTAAKRVCRYLNGSRTHGVILGKKDEEYPLIRGFCDSDWASNEGRKSISGYLIQVYGNIVCWSSKQQVVVALSSCEAEYLATTHAAKQIMWMRNFMRELGFKEDKATSLYCDNQGTICCMRDPQSHVKMKHIDLRYHFIRWCVNNDIIDIFYIPGVDNIADLFTKALPLPAHSKWVRLLELDSVQGGVLEEHVPNP
jgi:hypothetical protein